MAVIHIWRNITVFRLGTETGSAELVRCTLGPTIKINSSAGTSIYTIFFVTI